MLVMNSTLFLVAYIEINCCANKREIWSVAGVIIIIIIIIIISVYYRGGLETSYLQSMADYESVRCLS